MALKIQHTWIEDIKTNPDSALKKIYKEEREYCLAWLAKNTSLGKNDCVEIFQSTVIILYDNVMTGKLVEASSKLSSYLISICRNKSLELYRQNKKAESEDKLPILSEYIKEEEGYEEKHTKLINGVNQILREMGSPCRNILELFYYQKMNMSDISTIMGYSNTDTAKNQKYKCLKRLRNKTKDINR